jgi:hypothetical protein
MITPSYITVIVKDQHGTVITVIELWGNPVRQTFFIKINTVFFLQIKLVSEEPFSDKEDEVLFRGLNV